MPLGAQAGFAEGPEPAEHTEFLACASWGLSSTYCVSLLPIPRVRVQCELHEWGQLPRGVLPVPEGLHGHCVRAA